jgi:hypothetical protein
MKSLRTKAFLEGWASAFDLSGKTTLEVPDYTAGPIRDAKAIRQDWKAVGRDIRHGMDTCIPETCS